MTTDINQIATSNGATINNVNYALSPLMYFDQIISIKIIKTIEKLIQNFDKKTFGILLVLFGADFLKRETSNMFKLIT